jgi:flavin-dependent dehydrogenase
VFKVPDLAQACRLGLLKEFMKSRFPNKKVMGDVAGVDPSSEVIESATADDVMLVGDAAIRQIP